MRSNPTSSRAHARPRGMRALAHAILGIIVVLSVSVSASLGASTQASTVVTAEVLSATNLNVAAGCPSQTADITDFGQLLPGNAYVTANDCTITFGSSNDTSRLRMHQLDLGGSAMYSLTRGDYDTDFNTTGIVTFDDGVNHNPIDDMATLPDGRIVGVGKQAMVRYDPDGTTDNTFGTLGYQDLNMGNNESIHAVLPLPDGKTLFSGIAGGGIRPVVGRVNADGSWDTSFDTDGYHDGTNTCACTQGVAAGLVVDSQGRALAAMWDGASDVNIIRLTTSGALDATWGTAGILTVPGIIDSYDPQIIILPDDSLLIAATLTNDITVTKLDADGALDLGFGGGTGTVTHDFGANTKRPSEIMRDPVSGSIYVASTEDGITGSNRVVVAKLDTVGSFDTSWNGTGTSVADQQNNHMYAGHAVLHPNGAVSVAADFEIAPCCWDHAMAVVRFAPDGTKDTSFDDDGLAMLRPGAVDTEGRSIAEGYDGDIYAGGIWKNIAQGHVLARFDGISVPDFNDGVNDWDDSVAPADRHFGACLVSLASSGSAAASAPWSDTGSCTATDGDPWVAIDADGSGGSATIATETTSGTTDATADLRFGFRTGGDQIAGQYMAPLVIEAVAPNA